MAGQLHGNGAVLGFGHLHLGVGQEGFGNLTVEAVVFHQQHPLVAQVPADGAVGRQHFPGRQVEAGARRQAQVEAHDGAPVALARQLHLAAHQLQQVTADAQAQTRAPHLARHRRVGLAELLENAGHELRLDAHAGVFHPKHHRPIGAVGSRLVVAPDGHLTRFGKLDGVAGQVQQHLPDAVGVAEQHSRHGRGQLHYQAQAFFHGLVVQGLLHFGQQVRGHKADVLQHHLTRFELRQVQNIVDDDQQVLGRGGDGLPVAVLLGSQQGFGQQLAHAQNGVHRGADFVAHVGQKLLAGPHRRLGRQLGVAQLLLGVHPFGDVEAIAHDDVQAAVGVKHRLQAPKQVAGALGPREAFLERHQPAFAHGFLHVGLARLGRAGGVVAVGTKLGGGFAHRPHPQVGAVRGADVDKLVAELAVEHHHIAGHLVQHELVELALLSQLLLGLPALGDVQARAHQHPQRPVGPEHRAEVPPHLLRPLGRENGFFPGRLGAGAHRLLERPPPHHGQLRRALPVGAVVEVVLADNPRPQLRVAEAVLIHELVAVLGVEHGHLYLQLIEDGFVEVLLLGQPLLQAVRLGFLRPQLGLGGGQVSAQISY